MTHHEAVNIHDLCEAVNAIPCTTCDYEHPGYFAIFWQGRIYALGTVNGVWAFESADAADEFDVWGPSSEAELPLTATTKELLEFIKQHILI